MRIADIGRFTRFALVGGSGVIVNSVIFIALADWVGIDYRLASPVATEIAILSNFTLNRLWTFSDAGPAPLRTRLWRYHLTAFGGFLVHYATLIALVDFQEWDKRLANLVGIAVGMAWNYIVNVKWAWRRIPYSSPK